VEFTNNHEETPVTGEKDGLMLYGTISLYSMLAMGVYWMLTRRREETQQ
jgi:hypothetical protein